MSDTSAPFARPPRSRATADDRAAAFLAGIRRPVAGLSVTPAPRPKGARARGVQLMAGNFRLGGRLVTAPGQVPWDIAPPDAAFQDALHGFDWLDDLLAVEEPVARSLAQLWLASWLRRHGRGQGPGWAADLTGRRQMQWIAHAAVLMADQAPRDGRAFRAALGRQTGMLSRRWKHAAPGLPRFAALCALVQSACCLTGMEARLTPAVRALSRECATGIDASGGIASRNPEELLEVFALLTETATLLRTAERDGDPALDTAIARIAPALRSLQHGDGALVRMHGGGRGAPGRLKAALDAADLPPARVRGLAMGYARLSGQDLSVIVDAAPPLQGPRSAEAHASTLAFEMTAAEQPLIVSCGAGRAFGPDWRRAGRATPSHSTLVLDGYSSSRIARGAARADPERQGFAAGPETVEVQEAETENAASVALSHDGWLRTHGLVHLRSLTLDRDGKFLRGEDGLTAMTDADRKRLDRVRARLPEGRTLRYALRFHLHPVIGAELDLGGTAVSLRAPDGNTWVFRADGPVTLGLQRSVYLDARRLRPRATKQIVLTGAVTGYGGAVTWTLSRPIAFLPSPAP